MKKYLIVSLFILFLVSVQAQTYCQNCVGDNFTYLCNGKGCQGFSVKTANPHPIITGIQCRLMSPCYIQDKYDNSTNTSYWVACNFTMNGCDTCVQKTACSLCYPGYHPYNAEIDTDKNICKACSDSIPGCLKCLSGSSCLVCESQYRIIGGLCYNKDGTLVNGVSNSTTGIFVLLIILTIFMGIGMIMMGFMVKRRYIDRQRHQPLIHS